MQRERTYRGDAKGAGGLMPDLVCAGCRTPLDDLRARDSFYCSDECAERTIEGARAYERGERGRTEAGLFTPQAGAVNWQRRDEHFRNLGLGELTTPARRNPYGLTPRKHR